MNLVIIDFVLIFTNFFYDKKKLPFYFCFITSISFDQLDFSTSTEGRRLDATGINGQSLLKKYAPDATGSPFINPNWVQANLTLSEGKITGPISIKLNIENNTLYFLDSSGKEMVAIDGLVKKIDADFMHRKISNALNARKQLKLNQHSNGMRLIHGESGGLPGLIVVARRLSARLSGRADDCRDYRHGRHSNGADSHITADL